MASPPVNPLLVQEASDVANDARALLLEKEQFFNMRLREKDDQLSALQTIVDEFAAAHVCIIQSYMSCAFIAAFMIV